MIEAYRAETALKLQGVRDQLCVSQAQIEKLEQDKRVLELENRMAIRKLVALEATCSSSSSALLAVTDPTQPQHKLHELRQDAPVVRR